MGRAENCVKNTWKKIIRREKITDLNTQLPQLMESLKMNAMVEDPGIPEFCKLEDLKIQKMPSDPSQFEEQKFMKIPGLELKNEAEYKMETPNNSNCEDYPYLDKELDNLSCVDCTM